MIFLGLLSFKRNHVQSHGATPCVVRQNVLEQAPRDDSSMPMIEVDEDPQPQDCPKKL